MVSPTKASLLWVLLLLLAAPPLHAQAGDGKSGGKSIFCCEDDSGRPVCGDVLPSQCYGRAYREMNSQGVTRRHVSAPLTKAELARREAEAKARAEAEERDRIQRRQDEALFETYPTLGAIDEREARAIAEVERSVEGVLAREQELLVQRKRYDEETEFYRGRDLPRDLKSALQVIDSELASHKEFLKQKEGERALIRERFDADRQRYIELLASGHKRR
ncbi:MAG TPA: hypothetical protein PLR02_01675 [Rhodocyclaceae bacterium]|nr:hypothetical protein [Rhodocyclaceae bacterium]